MFSLFCCPQIMLLMLRKKCLYSELFWSVFSRIQTEYGEIRSISPYSVRMRANADQNNSKYEHFSRSVMHNYIIHHGCLLKNWYSREKPLQLILLFSKWTEYIVLPVSNKFCPQEKYQTFSLPSPFAIASPLEYAKKFHHPNARMALFIQYKQ